MLASSDDNTRRDGSGDVEARGSPVYLIVNADDFAYFNCVSDGILELAAEGRVTATAVMANSPNFPAQAARIKNCPDLDVGVHLNVTYGKPLSSRMAAKLAFNHREFPGKGRMALSILSRRVSVADVEAEWREQIARCLEAGLEVMFLNSHEHIHAFPGLFRRAQLLAREFAIPYLRVPCSEWSRPFTPGAIARNLALDAVNLVNGTSAMREAPKFIGLARSGRISLEYLKDRFSALMPNGVYELMCHPGRFDPSEITDSALLAYHGWEQELAVLKSRELKALYEALNIRLVRYRDLAGLL